VHSTSDKRVLDRFCTASGREVIPFTAVEDVIYSGYRSVRLMRMTTGFISLCFGVTACLLVASGCSTSKFYRVTDSASGKAYYTPRVSKEKKTGVVHFIDAATGVQVTLTRPEVKKISRERFNEGLHPKK
jgi:hypothetical protein